jgi:tellurite methyltransferase
MHSPLLEKYLGELKQLSCQLPILDLACGNGRNGLFCLEHKLPITFADIKEQALADIKDSIAHERNTVGTSLASFLKIDFEQANLEQINTNPLMKNSYSAVMVFRYLHRPLIEQIKAAVIPNGLVIYETFTVDQAAFGRPKNPDFLLKTGELAQYFSDWQILHSFEGIKTSDTGDSQQAIAQIVARKY